MSGREKEPGRAPEDDFSRLVAGLETRLYRTALVFCGSRQEALELLQETLFALYLSLPRFRRRSSVYTFAWRIMANLNAKRVRRRRSLEKMISGPVPGTAAVAESPAGAFARRERNEAVRRAISSLPGRYQVVIMLRYIEDLPIAGIARELSIPENTVRTRLARARDRLRLILGPGEEGAGRLK